MSSTEETVKEGIKAILVGGVAGIVVKDTNPTIWIDLTVDMFLIVVILALYVAIEHAEDFFGAKMEGSEREMSRTLRPYRVLSNRFNDSRE